MKKLLIGSAVILSIAGTIAYTANKPIAATGDDLPPLVKTVQRHDEELANHEARITNTESDVKDLQSNTATPPSNTRTEVPQVTTQPVDYTSPTPEPKPQPVTVTSTGYYSDIHGSHYCILNYSDGTQGQAPDHPTTHTNPDGSVSSNPHCDDYIGQTKS